MEKTVILYSTACFILLTVVLIIGCHQEIQPATPSSSLTIPSAPSNLILNAVSQTEVQLMWEDTSDNEDGFRIFRDGILILDVDTNVKAYHDIGLQPATYYQYSVIAFNRIGESQPCSNSIETLNPPVRILLDGIGVYDNREPLLREMGDVYVLIGIVDGSNSVELKFPQGQGQTYSLDKNETVSIDTIVYATSEVADRLQIFFVGYESDGGPFEQIAYEVLGMAVDYYTAGMTTGLAEAFDINLVTIIGSILGEEDDFLGQYELRCDKNNNWGIGQYTDIVLQDERGVDCLRLWFTIESQ